MIVIPRGWSVVHELESFSLVHPEGRDVAVIEYHERLRPFAKVGALVRRVLDEHREFTCSEVPDLVERIITYEGEFGALATLPGSEAGRPVQRDVGFVFGDDFYARISGACYDPARVDEVAALVRDLVVADTHALGVRRRRFEYAVPRGWQPLVRGFVTDWLAPDFPRDHVHLTVYPANPIAVVPQNLLAILLGVPRHGRTPSNTPLATSSGLKGVIGEVVAPDGDGEVVKRCTVLYDQHYAYALEVTARHADQLAAHRDLLDDVFASVQPLPAAQEQPHHQDFAAHSYWIE